MLDFFLRHLIPVLIDNGDSCFLGCCWSHSKSWWLSTEKEKLYSLDEIMNSNGTFSSPLLSRYPVSWTTAPSPLSSSLKWSLQSDEMWSWQYLVGYYAAGHLCTPGPQVSEASAPFLSHILSPPEGLFWFKYHKFLILLINLSHLNFIFRYLYQEIICMTSKLSHTWETFSCFLSTSKAIWSLNLEGWRLISTGFWVPVSQRSRRPLFSLLWPLLQDIQAFPVLCLPVTTFWFWRGFVWGEHLEEASLTSIPLPGGPRHFFSLVLL